MQLVAFVQRVRLNQSGMHGIDFNQGRAWAGSTAAFIPAARLEPKNHGAQRTPWWSMT
ncbi:MAG: hypothetical protein ABI222_13760 [Opitutaceae bacterium]